MKSIALIGVLTLAAGAASADTITGRFLNVPNGVTLNVSTGNLNVGALRHEWTNGNGEAARFNGTYATFCVDNKNATGTATSFELREVTNAPRSTAGNYGNPGNPYTAMQAKRLAAVVKAAQDLGRMGSRGEFITTGTDDNLWSAAIQLAVWESLWESTNGAGWDLAGGTFVLNSTNGTSNNVRNRFNTLIASATTFFNTNNVAGGVRVLAGTRGTTNETAQDQLVIVPLPPAAWAGLGALAGVMGVGYVRRRKLAAE